MAKKAVKEKKYRTFEAMIRGHKVLNYNQILKLNEPVLEPFIEEEEWANDVAGANIFACMDSGRALVKILKKHNLHVITLSIFDGEEDEEGESSCTYSYSTGFHWVNRERYYLCRNKTPALYEDVVDFD